MSTKPQAVASVALLIGVCLVGALQAGCGSSVREVRLALVSTKSVNQDDSGSPLPVMVRVYQLRSKEKFDQASFNTLWKGDTDYLGADLLERKDVTVHPDTEVIVDLEVDTKKGAQFVGVMALFRKPEEDTWKQAFPSKISHWNPFGTPKVKLMLDQYSLKLSEK